MPALPRAPSRWVMEPPPNHERRPRGPPEEGDAPMKLIGAGMPRTGTLTQKMALEMLGLGPCYHMVDVLADLEQAKLWERALDGEAPWDEVFADYQSTVDWRGVY